jgi:hypothetical protein
VRTTLSWWRPPKAGSAITTRTTAPPASRQTWAARFQTPTTTTMATISQFSLPAFALSLRALKTRRSVAPSLDGAQDTSIRKEKLMAKKKSDTTMGLKVMKLLASGFELVIMKDRSCPKFRFFLCFRVDSSVGFCFASALCFAGRASLFFLFVLCAMQQRVFTAI